VVQVIIPHRNEETPFARESERCFLMKGNKMSVTLSAVRIVPYGLIAWRLHCLNWRVNYLDRQLIRLDSKKHRTSLIVDQAAVRHELSGLAYKTTLEVTDKHDKETTLREERRRIESKLIPLNQAYDNLTRQRATCYGRRRTLSLKK